MTKTGILALLTVVVVIFIIGIVGFIFAKVRLNPTVATSPERPAVEVTPRSEVLGNVASPTAVISQEEARLQLPSQSDGGQATPSAWK